MDVFLIPCRNVMINIKCCFNMNSQTMAFIDSREIVLQLFVVIAEEQIALRHVEIIPFLHIAAIEVNLFFLLFYFLISSFLNCTLFYRYRSRLI